MKYVEKLNFCCPCIDLAHAHAFKYGSMKNKENIVTLLFKFKNLLGDKIAKEWHFHMYPVDYNNAGEKGHKAFGDKKENVQFSLFGDCDDGYYPRAEDFISAIHTAGIDAVVICEAKDSQDIGAILLKNFIRRHYENCASRCPFNR